MFLLRHRAHDGRLRVAVRLDEASVVDIPLPDDGEPCSDPMRELAVDVDARSRASAVIAAPPTADIHRINDLDVVAPFDPVKVRNFSVYEGHIRDAVHAAIELRAGSTAARLVRAARLGRPPRGWYSRPLYYKGNHLSVAGPYDDILQPAFTSQLDYEMELAVVIGRPGRNIAPSEAMSHVFGYTMLNDVSARDELQGELFTRMGPAKGKDFDTGNVIGPWIATPDEIPDPYALVGTVSVNGSTRSRCTTDDMHHDIPAIIAEASRCETIHPMELIGTGCCTGGSGLEHRRFLEVGDLVEMTLGPLGTQRNHVVR